MYSHIGNIVTWQQSLVKCRKFHDLLSSQCVYCGAKPSASSSTQTVLLKEDQADCVTHLIDGIVPLKECVQVGNFPVSCI